MTCISTNLEYLSSKPAFPLFVFVYLFLLYLRSEMPSGSLFIVCNPTLLLRLISNHSSFPVLWPPHVKSWVIGKDSDAERDWGQEEKGTTEDEMVGWYHWLNGHESEWTPGDGDGQGGLACYDSWGHKVSDTTERLNWSNLYSSSNVSQFYEIFFWEINFFLILLLFVHLSTIHIVCCLRAKQCLLIFFSHFVLKTLSC